MVLNMNFNLSEENQLFLDTVRNICRKEIKPLSEKIDNEGSIPKELLDKLAKVKLIGITIPEKYGGMNGTVLQSAIAGMEIGRADISMATAVYYLLNAGWGKIFSKYGTEEAKEEVLTKVTDGKAFLGVASTETGGGSDLYAIKTVAKKEGSRYIVNGEKGFISGVTEARELGGGHLTIVKTDPSKRTKGMSLIYIPAQSPGISVQTYKNMGRMGISTGELTYDNVEVDEKYLLKGENDGYGLLIEGFMTARTLVSSACIGAAEEALEIGIEHLKKREAFGGPLARYEGLQFEMVELYTHIEMVKLMIYKAATLIDEYENGKKVDLKDINMAVSMVKLRAPEVAFDTFKKVMMWHGAMGYTKEAGLEKGLRGVTSYLVGAEGALNIMRLIIVRELLGRDYMPYK
ncbi:MAG: acyl-CoA/acyl-ACP dehydrogenase [Candidatus Thermoplasmatota archaeon]|jgi:acyl-CoA dehydrogenase|nr:acyl-CoA/acyl-ACP dehydrogenase [Candidatus Thermoplasmatota archaeon]MCL5963042.1 acyl-CoA/acyl-ACP dehydrogenase [Candidatus Thermoplasmatota archaeon]